MSTETPINDVTDTSFWVAYYRAKESVRPDALFQDRFASALVGERGRRISESMPSISKYTEWSVISRTVIIDRFIQKLIQDGVDAVINLGAGLDARPYRMSLPSHLEWVEVDYPKIIQHKSQILKEEKPHCKLTRVEVDLADDEKRKSFLNSVVPQAKKVLILTEGVIPYLSPEQVAELADNLYSQKRFAFWITEYFHPSVYPYLKGTVRSLKMKNAPFRFYPEDWNAFFRNHNWIEKETNYAGDIAIEFKRSLPMPALAKIILWFLPAKIERRVRNRSGHMIFKRKDS